MIKFINELFNCYYCFTTAMFLAQFAFFLMYSHMRIEINFNQILQINYILKNYDHWFHASKQSLLNNNYRSVKVIIT